MAPPQSADLPLGQRLTKLVQSLKFAWFTGHFVLIIATVRYMFSWLRMNYYSGIAQFSYRLTFIAAAVTYGIVVHKAWRARQKTGTKLQGGALAYASDENIQYLIMALIWLFMPQHPLAMLPYCIYSVFHVATYTRVILIPTIVPPKLVASAGTSPNATPQYTTHPLADAIGALVKQYYDMSMSVVSGLEILLWVRLLASAVLFQRRSWILLAVYTAFLRTRFSQSSHVQNSFSQLEARIDNLVGAQGTPPVARQVWEGTKGAARQFHAATDVNKYTNGAAVPKKTT